MRQVSNLLTPVVAITPQVLADTGSPLTGSAVDCRGYQEVIYVLSCGAATTLVSLDVKVQESASSGGSYADTSPASAFAQITTATHQKKLMVKVNPAKPFHKAVATLVGNGVDDAGDIALSLVALLVNPNQQPAADGA